MEGKRRSRGDGCLANSTNIHQSNSTSFPADRGEGEPTVSVYLKGHGWVCVCACASAGLRPSLFPKEVSLDNKHSHSSSPADLINKTSSSEYTLSLSLTHTHRPPFPHITGEHEQLSTHEMTCFHVCGWKKRRRELSIPAACNCSQLWPPLPKIHHSSHLSHHTASDTHMQAKKKKTHTHRNHTHEYNQTSLGWCVCYSSCFIF